VCHCLACQRRTGSAFGAQARFARDQIQIEGHSSQYRRAGDSGQIITFHFCPDCATTLYWEFEHLPEAIAVALGTFADPTFPTPQFSVYDFRKHPWVGLPDALKRDKEPCPKIARSSSNRRKTDSTQTQAHQALGQLPCASRRDLSGDLC
jgi:hypothetical protein